MEVDGVLPGDHLGHGAGLLSTDHPGHVYRALKQFKLDDVIPYIRKEYDHIKYRMQALPQYLNV